MTQENSNIESSTIPIHRCVPDAYFTQAQYDRMQTLLARRTDLTEEEDAELDALIGAELEAAISRTPLLH